MSILNVLIWYVIKKIEIGCDLFSQLYSCTFMQTAWIVHYEKNSYSKFWKWDSDSRWLLFLEIKWKLTQSLTVQKDHTHIPIIHRSHMYFFLLRTAVFIGCVKKSVELSGVKLNFHILCPFTSPFNPVFASVWKLKDFYTFQW